MKYLHDVDYDQIWLSSVGKGYLFSRLEGVAEKNADNNYYTKILVNY